MNVFRTAVSVIIMVVCSAAGLFIGASLGSAVGGCILGALISGIACIIYTLDNQNSK